MNVSVLTVTARQTSLQPLAEALARQVIASRNLGPGRPAAGAVSPEWIIVDAHYPGKRELLVRLQREILPRWRVVYGPAPESWAKINGYRFLASARNASLLLAGRHVSPASTLCMALDDDLVPEGDHYLATLVASARRGVLLIPPISYEKIERSHPSGNAATPFPLDEALGLNGYDEILDANWPGTATYEDVDLCFRLKALGLTLQAGPPATRLLHGATQRDHVTSLKGIKCNHALRVAGSAAEAGGGNLNWETNEGVQHPEPFRWLWGSSCPYLDRERCTFLGRRCEIDLGVARFGSNHLEAFLVSRPKVNMMEEWMKTARLRNRFVIGEPMLLEFKTGT